MRSNELPVRSKRLIYADPRWVSSTGRSGWPSGMSWIARCRIEIASDKSEVFPVLSKRSKIDTPRLFSSLGMEG